MILGAENRDEGGKKYTVFKVELRSDIGPWIVYRRYRQFFELDTKLRERFPSFTGQMPKKKVSGNMNAAFVEERKRGLERYLEDVVSDANAVNSPDFRAFIDANRNCSAKLSEAVAGNSLVPGGGSKQRLQRKIAVLGFMGVGKSAVTIQFTEVGHQTHSMEHKTRHADKHLKSTMLTVQMQPSPKLCVEGIACPLRRPDSTLRHFAGALCRAL